MEMNSPVGTNALDVGAQGVVGKPLDRVDGRLKVTGGARYAYEMQQGNNTLYGFVVEASIGKGKIKSIDTRAAENAPGVVLVLTHRNAPAQGTGNHREAHPVFTGPEVTRYGEPVAFVVAETFEQARAAAYLVDVRYDRANGKYALRANLDLARVPHPKDAPAADSAVGDFASAFAGAPVQIDVTYTTPLQSHAMMEPHATLAMWEGDKLILYTANQMLNQGQKAVARTLKIPVEKVRLVSPFIGGGFRRQALGQCRCHSGGDRVAAAQTAGENRADTTADLSRHDAPLGYHPAPPPGYGSERSNPRGRPRCVLGQFTQRANLRGRGTADPHALRRAKPVDATSSGTVGYSGCFVDARARRICRADGA